MKQIEIFLLALFVTEKLKLYWTDFVACVVLWVIFRLLPFEINIDVASYILFWFRDCQPKNEIMDSGKIECFSNFLKIIVDECYCFFLNAISLPWGRAGSISFWMFSNDK